MKYHRLFDNLPLAAIEIDDKGIVRTVNHMTEVMFECSKNELRGRHWLEYFPEISVMLPWDEINRLLTNKPNLFKIKKGHQFWVLCQIRWDAKHRCYLLCLTKNTTPTQVAQSTASYTFSASNEIRENNNIQFYNDVRFQQLISIYPVGIFHTDKDGKITYTNKIGFEILGLTGEETKKEEYCKTIHPDDSDMARQDWTNAINNQVGTDLTYRILNKSKTTWIRRIISVEKDADGKIIGYLGIISDITKAHETEAQLAKNQSEIAHFSRLNSMGALASSIAHELNQPLSAIITYGGGLKRRLKMITNPPIAQNVMDAVEHVITQAQRAGNIIHHLKDFLRKGTLNKKQTDINGAIKDVLVFVNRRMIQNGIAVRLMLNTQLPQIIADKIHIEQVVLNIVNNAIDAINEAAPLRRVITIRTKPIDHEKICISIADTGIGIGSDFLDLLFKPFATTKNEGMGIGLSLCYNIIEKHGGRIDIVTRHNKGTIFHIILPLDGGPVNRAQP